MLRVPHVIRAAELALVDIQEPVIAIALPHTRGFPCRAHRVWVAHLALALSAANVPLAGHSGLPDGSNGGMLPLMYALSICGAIHWPTVEPLGSTI